MHKIVSVIIIASFLSACGTTTAERGISGAAIGAGVGAVGGALAGGNPVAGAIVGGAVGAVVGTAVKKTQLDLGKPTWK